MATKQTSAYSEEQVREMIQAYTAVPTDAAHEAERDAVVKMLAEKFGKKPQSVRQKLVREDVYIAKQPKSKDGSPAETKKSIVGEIADLCGMGEVRAKELLLAGKPALQAVRDRLAELEADLDAALNPPAESSEVNPDQAESALDNAEGTE